MLIAPNTERWNEGETDWSYVRNALPAVERWEQREGIKLPEDYRKFILKYNGGKVYPRLFRNPFPENALSVWSPELMLSSLYWWDYVESHWRGETYGKQSVPPGHLLIGDDPGGVEIILAVDGPKRGTVSVWNHSTCRFGTDSNTDFYWVADSFFAFLALLFDDDAQSDRDGWHIPLYDKLAKKLELS